MPIEHEQSSSFIGNITYEEQKVKIDGKNFSEVFKEQKLSREEADQVDITAADIETLRSIPRKSINEFTSEEIEAALSVGIDNSHTPIMERTASNYTISDFYSLVNQFDKDFTPAHEVNSLCK